MTTHYLTAAAFILLAMLGFVLSQPVAGVCLLLVCIAAQLAELEKVTPRGKS